MGKVIPRARSGARRSAVRLLATVLTAALILPLASCDRIEPEELESTVYIASDTHLYSNNLISSDNELYTKEALASDGRIQERDYELAEALVSEVNRDGPEYLVLTGDLSYNGERDSHLELSRILSGVESAKVLVIPGNHDLYSQNSFTLVGDERRSTPTVTAEEFREIYADFGYTGGVTYDSRSLSYIYALNDDAWALMLDTTQSRHNPEIGENIIGGYIEETTMAWMREWLGIARERGKTVVSFMHHNLLVHNELFEAGYTLYKNEEVLALFAEFGVRLNFSGHLHIQSIESTVKDGSKIHDVASGSLLDYGNRYGRLEIYGNCFSYESRRLALADGELGEYARTVFEGEYYNKTVERYKDALGEEDGEAAAHLLARINAYYFDGSYGSINRLLRQNHALVSRIKAVTDNYNVSYVRSIIEVGRKDQHSLLVER